jgi:hypothetical protein
VQSFWVEKKFRHFDVCILLSLFHYIYFFPLAHFLFLVSQVKPVLNTKLFFLLFIFYFWFLNLSSVCFEYQVPIDSQKLQNKGNCIKIERQRIFNVKFLDMEAALVIFLKTCLGLDSYKSALNHV